MITNQGTHQNTNVNGVIVPEKTPVKTPEVPRQTPPNPRVRSDLFRRLEIIDGDADLGTGFRSGSQKRSGLKLALWTWLSASIDALVLVSMSCLFAIAFSFLMRTSPGLLFVTVVKSQHPLINLGLLFLLSTWSYLIFMRAFIGASIGEWTCDLRVGQPLQRFKSNYILKVMLRTTIVMLTGVFLLPLMSLLLARDIAGDLSGVRIYSLQ
ncbi:MAG: hypothetical protein H7256_11390 [Bdellovibrio sp.]|nr:hypothetical protein [Bdellovibrio sp.]